MSTPSLLNIPYRLKAGTLYSQLPETGAGDFTVTRATTPTAGQSTRVNAAGLIETVADNVPRLDYPLGGAVNGCPALLVEPSAQNQCQRSEEFNNAFHFPLNLNAFGSGSVANTTATRDPYGTNLADYIQENSAAGVVHGIIDVFAGNVSGTTYTWSVFAKAAERTIINLFNNAGGGGSATFNLTTGIATGGSMQNYGNGWWRCTLTYTSSFTGNHNVQIRLCDASGNSTYNGTGNEGAYIFGAQLEVGSVPTSYIPTTTAAVTRSADVISRTSASALIGQSEGTIYAEVDMRNAISRVGSIFQLRQDGNNQMTIGITTAFGGGANTISARVQHAGSFAVGFYQPNNAAGIYKIAFAYKSTDCKLYINGTDTGVIISTNNAFTAFSFNEIQLGMSNSANQFNDRIRAAALYPNRLPDTAGAGVLSLATLTTP